MNFTKKEFEEVYETMEGKMEFGDVPAFVLEKEKKEVFVCRNNGAFHKGNATSGSGGWADFLFGGTKEEFVRTYGREW